MQLDAVTLRRLWPQAPAALVDDVAARSAAVFAKHGLTSALRVAHFMAQISHESGGGTITQESLDYTHAERIAAVWPTRFTAESAQACVRNPKALADKVYDGRMGNGPAPSDDGFNYRGRGLLQITGRDSYRQIGGLCGLPLEDKPELAYSPLYTLEVAATEFVELGCLPFCDADNLNAVTRRVNGGYTGLAERKAWLARWKAVMSSFSTSNEDEKTDTPIPVPEPEPAESKHSDQINGNVKPETPPPAQAAPAPVSPAPPATQAALPPPPIPSLPRGSDEVLPPGVDTPGKTMAASKTGGAAVTVGAGGIIATVQAAHEAAGPLKDAKQDLQDLGILDMLIAGSHFPMFWVGLAIAGLAGFIWWDRKKRLEADHV